MASTKDTLAYLLQQYPHPSHQSAGRVTKMIYLADWKHSIDFGGQITNIRWYYNHYGPFVDKVIDTARSYPNLFDIKNTRNAHGDPKRRIECINNSYRPNLNESEVSVINHVISETEYLSWSKFIKLVYSTYPVIRKDQHTNLDLPRLAREYTDSDFYKRGDGPKEYA